MSASHADLLEDMNETKQVLLLDLAEGGDGVLAERLRMQGYFVVVARDPAEGARMALADPPAAVIADLWMPSISGVQLCRLLRAEPATERVPIILRGPESPRNRFWSEHAGAAAYVVSGRMGDLARALAHAVAVSPSGDGFFTAFPSGGNDIRERIAAHLDAALFESVLASEVRALGSCGAFPSLFDLLSQFVSRVTPYRWMAVATDCGRRLGLHTNPSIRRQAEDEARAALNISPQAALVAVEDGDAFDDPTGHRIIVRSIELGKLSIGRLAISPRRSDDTDNERFVSVIARELAGPIRMAMLVEESQRLASVDVLTGIMNRRAFTAALEHEVARSTRYGHPLSLILLDIDHFKSINDLYGHQTGDLVLSSIGQLLSTTARRTDLTARWGGEEFVVALTDTDEAGAKVFAERLREKIAALDVAHEGQHISVNASLGVTRLLEEEETISTLVARADRAMYAAKSGGRNRVWCGATAIQEVVPALSVVGG